MTSVRETVTNALGLSGRDGQPSALTLQVQGIAARLHCTEGQVYSMAIALSVATVLAVTGSVPLGKAVESVAAGQPPAAVVPDDLAGAGEEVPPADLGEEPGLTAVPELPGGGPNGDLPGGGSGVDAPNVEGPSDSSAPPPTDQSPDGPDFTELFKIGAPGSPAALAADARTLYVGTDDTSNKASVLGVYSRTGGLDRTLTIKGQPDDKQGGLAAAVLEGRVLYATDRSRAALIVVQPSRQKVLVALPDLPPCLVGVSATCQPGVDDRPPSPEGLVVLDGFAYIADAGQSTIWRYDLEKGDLVTWYANADMSAGSGPVGLATDGSRLVFSVSSALDLGAPLRGAVYRLAIANDGTAGERALIASFAAEDAPGAVAMAATGDVYVALEGTGGVKSINTAGSVSDVPGAGPRDIAAPRGLCLIDDVLYVADAGKGKSSGTVRAVMVSDGLDF